MATTRDNRQIHKEMRTPSLIEGVTVAPGTLPPDVVAEAATRLGILGLIYSATFFVATFAGHLIFVRFGPANWQMEDPVQLTVSVAAIVMGLGVFHFSRKGRMEPQALLDFGLVFMVVGALGISVAEYWGAFPPGTEFRLGENVIYLGIPWECVWIILFPLLAPNTPGKTLIASLAAASTGMLVIVVSKATGQADASVPLSFFAVYFLFSTYLCAGIAYAGSRFMLSLSSRLKKARDIGTYQLCEPLGQGGMGEVWRAEHRMLARPAAIKLIRPEVCGADEETRNTVLTRFEREARATASLSSHHTIDLYDFGFTENGQFYYVMELLDGMDLNSFVERFGPVSPARAVHFLRQACHSLDDAHAMGLIHRDIKPANIFVCRRGQDVDFIKVLDFGLVRRTDRQDREATRLTQDGVAAGTPSYMAPEAATGKGPVDGRADLYALGCVGYWLLTGEQLFDGDTPMSVVLKHVQDEPVPPSLRSEIDIPEGVEAAIMACLKKSPGDRPQSARELVTLLDEALPPDRRWTRRQAEEWWRIHLPNRRWRQESCRDEEVGEGVEAPDAALAGRWEGGSSAQ